MKFTELLPTPANFKKWGWTRRIVMGYATLAVATLPINLINAANTDKTPTKIQSTEQVAQSSGVNDYYTGGMLNGSDNELMAACKVTVRDRYGLEGMRWEGQPYFLTDAGDRIFNRNFRHHGGQGMAQCERRAGGGIYVTEVNTF